MRYKDLPREDVNEVDPRLGDALARGAFLEKENGSASAVSQPVMAYVHVTQRCNLACYGCYSDDERRNHLRDAPRSYFAAAFQKLASIETREIIVSGGEPFLRDDLGLICKDARNAGIGHITIISNGTLITEHVLDAIAPYVDCVSVSFDGPSADAPACIRGEQRFNELVSAVKLISQADIKAHIIPTIHGGNIDDIPAYLDLAESLGATLNFSVLSCCGNSEPSATNVAFNDNSLEYLGKKVFMTGSETSAAMFDTPLSVNLSIREACGAGAHNLSVGADGTVYPCHMLHYDELAMGNIFTDDIVDIMQSPISKQLEAITVESIAECLGCECGWFCGGGCRARAYSATKSLRSMDPFCPMTKTFYRHLGESLSEMLAE